MHCVPQRGARHTTWVFKVALDGCGPASQGSEVTSDTSRAPLDHCHTSVGMHIEVDLGVRLEFCTHLGGSAQNEASIEQSIRETPAYSTK